ncbi:MAG: 6-phosphogluconolactonase, partial [Victivallales bacterium]|nr:6-phosphogluconolactonase [Victivallales bacterium]
WKYYKNRLKNTEFFPVDERKVPVNSEDSNWGAAYRNFLSKINRDSDKENYTQSAVEYTELLKESFGAYDIIFNAVFLGVGDDGHTASLFPGTEHVDDLTNPVIETLSPIPPFERITLGSRVITAAEHLIVIVEGENKREVFRRILENDCTLPVVRILSRYNNGIIFVNNKLKHLYTKI